MGKMEGIRIQNYGSLKSIAWGKLFSNQDGKPLSGEDVKQKKVLSKLS
ncbi:MAG: hypothetical protein LBK75_08060 [Oscillospiraceae bacterium]|nr:hypothetical protein [Oscillospiraceae bacterium]